MALIGFLYNLRCKGTWLFNWMEVDLIVSLQSIINGWYTSSEIKDRTDVMSFQTKLGQKEALF